MAKDKDTAASTENTAAAPAAPAAAPWATPAAPQAPAAPIVAPAAPIPPAAPENTGDNQQTKAPEVKQDEKPAQEEVPEGTVIVNIPKAYQLRLDNHTVLKMNAGTQRVKTEIAEHWYSKANGVTIVK